MIKYTKFLVLNEGGHAFPNVKSIPIQYVQKTFEVYYKKVLKPIGLKLSDISILGSAGKKKISGDIDIGIDLKACALLFGTSDPKEILTLIADRIKKSVKGINAHGINSGQLYTKFPIQGQSGNVQVDLMIGKLKYLKFAYYAGTFAEVNPESEELTEYKGVYRNMLIMAIARSIQKQLTNTTYKRLVFNLNKGLFKDTKDMIGKSGKVIKKHKTTKRVFLTSDPKTVAKILLGPGFKPSDMTTYEKVLKAINSEKFHWTKLRRIIKDEFRKALDYEKLAYPKEM